MTLGDAMGHAVGDVVGDETGDAVGGPACARCGAATRGGGDWAVWCPACDDGVVRGEQPPSAGWWQARRDRSRRAFDDRYAAQLAADDLRHGLGSAYLLAAAIHLITVIVLVAGIVLIAIDHSVIPAVLLGLLLIAIAVVVRPRLPRVRGGVPLAERPLLAAYVAEVAAVVGCAVPDRLSVTGQLNASVYTGLSERFRPVTVLSLGAALWATLDAPGRTALLGHELGHLVAGDPARSWWINAAGGSLAGWQGLLQPVRYRSRRRGRNPVGLAGIFTAIGDLLVPLVLLPISTLVGIFGSAYLRVTRARSRRCEMLADRCAARVGGTAAQRQVLEVLVLQESIRIARSAEKARGGREDLPALLRQTVARVTPDELARRLRQEELVGDTGDHTHPPGFRRIRLVSLLTPSEPVVVVTAAQMAAIDAELAPALSAALR